MHSFDMMFHSAGTIRAAEGNSWQKKGSATAETPSANKSRASSAPHCWPLGRRDETSPVRSSLRYAHLESVPAFANFETVCARCWERRRP